MSLDRPDRAGTAARFGVAFLRGNLMRRLCSSRLVLALFLAATLGTPHVWAGSRTAGEGQTDRHEATSAVSQLWDLITALWGDAGCIMDPHGGCTAVRDASVPEAGCGLDPHGSCTTQSTPSTDAGCGI